MAKALRDIRSHPHPRCCLAVPRALNAFFSPFLREERSLSRQKRPVRNQPHGSPRATYPPGRPSYGKPLELRGRGGSIRSPGAPRALNPPYDVTGRRELCMRRGDRRGGYNDRASGPDV